MRKKGRGDCVTQSYIRRGLLTECAREGLGALSLIVKHVDERREIEREGGEKRQRSEQKERRGGGLKGADVNEVSMKRCKPC